jgi:biotin carboxyl carrier protein
VNEIFVLRSEDSGVEPARFANSAGGIAIPGEKHAGAVRVLRRERSGLCVLLGDRVISGLIQRDADGHTLEIESEGKRYRGRVRTDAVDAMEQKLHGPAAANGALKISSPIPGLVKEVRIVVGDTVQAGQTIVVLEAMKMENQIAAPHDGTVETLAVAAGQTVPAGALLLILKT